MKTSGSDVVSGRDHARTYRYRGVTRSAQRSRAKPGPTGTEVLHGVPKGHVLSPDLQVQRCYTECPKVTC